MIFRTDDIEIQNVFDWAATRALECRGNPQDPVGPWYEAALPNRSAFCMRDVAHQCIGAELLGMHAENQNMLGRFLAGIAESRDWCSYWEIDKSAAPAPVDYDSDSDFWYCLPANMDILYACIRLWKLTGDTDILTSDMFRSFAEATLTHYLNKWQLTPELLMSRPMRMHPGNGRFGDSRGLASYDEARDGITVGSDLAASLVAALKGMADWHTFGHDHVQAQLCNTMADRYKTILNDVFWNEREGRFFDYRLDDGSMADGSTAGGLFPAWFGAVDRPEKVRLAINTVTTEQIEILSYAPVVFWRSGYPAIARDKLLAIAASERRDDPEASFGAIEGIVCGLLGIRPLADRNTIYTRSGLMHNSGFVEVSELPVYPGRVTVKHIGTTNSEFVNHSECRVVWRAEFSGRHMDAIAEGKSIPMVQSNTDAGESICYTEILVPPGAAAAVQAA